MLNRISAALAAIGLAALSSHDLPRTALWRVEQACMASFRLTGSPFPCLEVQLEPNPAQGYVVLESPDRARDIVLMPAVRVTGLEDPFLSRRHGANYFARAWSVRHFVEAKAGRPMAHGDVGLAVNSRIVRTQDQLHIHVDCLAPGVRQSIAAVVPHLPTDSWSATPRTLRGQAWFARLVGSDDLGDTDIMSALHDSPPARDGHFGTLAAAVIGATLPGDRKGFVLLATDTRKTSASPESLLDHSCGRARHRDSDPAKF